VRLVVGGRDVQVAVAVEVLEREPVVVRLAAQKRETATPNGLEAAASVAAPDETPWLS
jgi:hypothetical protein